MNSDFVSKTALEFEKVLLDNFDNSDGAKTIYKSMQPFIEKAKNGTIHIPVDDLSSFNRALAEGYIEIPSEVESHYSKFKLLLELGENEYHAAMEKVRKIVRE